MGAWRGARSSLPGAGPGLWGRMELGLGSSFDSHRGDLEVRRRPLGTVHGWASRALPAAREAWGTLGGPGRVLAPQHHPCRLGGPVTSPGSQRNEGTRATELWARVDWEPPAPRESGEGLALWGASGSRLPAPPPSGRVLWIHPHLWGALTCSVLLKGRSVHGLEIIQNAWICHVYCSDPCSPLLVLWFDEFFKSSMNS